MTKAALDEFERRRRQLIRTMGHDAIAVLPAAPPRTRNNDVEYNYRQDSDFHYLTGFDEPEAVAVLAPGRPKGEYILFVRERNKEREIWDGKRSGPEGAIKEYGADAAYPIGKLDEVLPGLLSQRSRVFHTMGVYSEFDQRVAGWINTLRSQARAGSHPPQEFAALDHVLHDMRLYKSRAEVGLMKRAGEIAAAAHVRAMKFTAPGKTEYQVMAEILHEFHRHNADISYHPIVGGGANSCVLHYRANNAMLKSGDLLLIDAGCEYQFYASDVTRTIPVNGRYSREQRAVYEVVLAAQRAAFAEIKPGNHWNAPHDAAVKATTQGLVKLGLLKGRVPQLIKDGAYKQYFMHRTGHWLGMDVHDVGDYKVQNEWRVFEPGMALTVEPGCYIAAGSKAPKKWWNIGIRIEDDVVVTPKGHEVLSGNVPREAEQIEKLMARR